MSDTPRTDAVERSICTMSGDFNCVPVETARLLERENTKLRALLTEWHEGAYYGRDFLRLVRLILHGANGLREVGHNKK